MDKCTDIIGKEIAAINSMQLIDLHGWVVLIAGGSIFSVPAVVSGENLCNYI